MFLQKTLLIALSCIAINSTVFAQSNTESNTESKQVTSEQEFQMALLHLKPKASKQFKQKGMLLLEEAGAKGHLKAQLMLTRAYKRGYLTKKNDRKAFLWASKAAAQNNAEAITYLAVMYLEGNGVKKDTQKGIKLLSSAKNQGYAKAKEIFDALNV